MGDLLSRILLAKLLAKSISTYTKATTASKLTISQSDYDLRPYFKLQFEHGHRAEIGVFSKHKLLVPLDCFQQSHFQCKSAALRQNLPPHAVVFHAISFQTPVLPTYHRS